MYVYMYVSMYTYVALYIYRFYTYIGCLVTKPCPTLFWPINCSLQGSPVHGISQARMLEWVAISFSRGSSEPRDQAYVFCIGRWILYHWATREAPHIWAHFFFFFCKVVYEYNWISSIADNFSAIWKLRVGIESKRKNRPGYTYFFNTFSVYPFLFICKMGWQ